MVKKFLSLLLIISIITINFGFFTPETARAAGLLTVLSDTVSNLTFNAVANHTIQFTTPTGVAANATIILTFDNGTNTGTVDYTDIDIKDDNSDLTINGTSPSGAAWGAVNTSSTVITLTNGSTPVAAASVVNIEIGTNATYGPTGTHQITNGSSGGTTTTLRFSGTFADTGVISMAIVTNGVVSLTAEVLASLTFTISDNTIYFGNLKSSGTSCWAQGTDPLYITCPTIVETEAFNMTAATNGSTGYTISVQGPTLTSGGNTIAALATSTAPIVGTEQFGIRMDKTGGGTGVVQAPYATAGQYAFAATSSTPSTVALASVATASSTYSVRYMANISTVTKAGSYSANHTYIATGNF